LIVINFETKLSQEEGEKMKQSNSLIGNFKSLVKLICFWLMINGVDCLKVINSDETKLTSGLKLTLDRLVGQLNDQETIKALISGQGQSASPRLTLDFLADH
jgi:hypothetical protein